MIIVEDGRVELYGEPEEVMADTTILLHHILLKYQDILTMEKLFENVKIQIKEIEKMEKK